MELTFIKAAFKRLCNGDFEISLIVPRSKAAAVERFQAAFKAGELWIATVKKHRQKRSLDANDYCWVLLRKIAENLAEMNPDEKAPDIEDIYRSHIKDVGVYEPLPIRADAVRRFCEAWKSRGIGWFVEVVDDSKLEGYKRVHAYYGSSTYDTREMSRLIDNIVQDCKALGIETLPPHELERLKEEWK